ncbi:MAG: chloride channel protein [Kiritimatiellae bacterium]|nr:chloride channel protein [Kiritimatiellia bacterium]
MFRRLSINSFKLFLAGNGVTAQAGREFILFALVGVVVGFCTLAFNWMITLGHSYLLGNFSFHHSQLQAGEIGYSPFDLDTYTNPWRWFLFITPAIGALLGACLIRWLGHSRHARGTDTAVFAYHHNAGHITSTAIPVKSVASVLTVESGGSGGYEGPMTLIGAACGSTLARILHLDPRLKRLMMAAGLAAGIGALFRAPLAGVLFGAEIFYSGTDMEYETFLPSFIASSIAYTIYACFVGFEPLFSMPDYAYDDGVRLLPYIALAIIVAIGVRFYIMFFRGTEEFCAKLKWPFWVKVSVGGLCVGAIGFFCPDVMGASYNIIDKAFKTHDAGANMLSFLDLPCWGFFCFFIIKAIATSFTVGSGGSAGVFAPALVCGCALGAAVGIFFQGILPETFGVKPGAFALVGMAAFIAGAVRAPLMAIVMVAELSGNHTLILPSMWVCGITFWLNSGWSLYRSQVRERTLSELH